MDINWTKLLTSIAAWAIAELALNSIGLDTLADYSEFLNNKYHAVNIEQTAAYW